MRRVSAAHGQTCSQEQKREVLPSGVREMFTFGSPFKLWSSFTMSSLETCLCRSRNAAATSPPGNTVAMDALEKSSLDGGEDDRDLRPRPWVRAGDRSVLSPSLPPCFPHSSSLHIRSRRALFPSCRRYREAMMPAPSLRSA